MRKKGYRKEKTGDTRMAFHLEKELYLELGLASVKEHKSMSAILRQALREYLEKGKTNAGNVL